MNRLTARQIYQLAIGAGLSPAKAVIATAIALAESGGNADAEGDLGIQDNLWGPSVGLWQVRSLKAEYGTGRARDASRLKDPQFNARSMASISSTGSNFRPWSTYTQSTNSYTKQLPKARAASTGAPEPAPAGSGIELQNAFLSPAAAIAAGIPGLNLVIGPGGWLGRQLAGLAGNAASSVAGAIWDDLKPFIITAMVGTAGLALVVMGIRRTVEPTVQKVENTATQTAAVIAAPETGGASLAAAGAR